MALEAEGERVVEAARPLNHGASTGATPENRNIPLLTVAFQYFTGESLTKPQDDKGSGGLPEPEEFPSGGLGFSQKSLIPGKEIGGLSASQVNELHPERMSQSGEPAK